MSKTFKWTVPEPKHTHPSTSFKKPISWTCAKCRYQDYDVGEFHAAGSTLAKFFDIQTDKFSTITCKQCYYTEIYKCRKSDLENVLDFFVGS